eukprot:GEMP01002673.1.p1 GENE.GEMP01002673.1~~GEMP01002673.1.p1  ORF type:complete len:1143 (+),score=308.47 GEMP01002673.1:271-3699(+)
MTTGESPPLLRDTGMAMNIGDAWHDAGHQSVAPSYHHPNPRKARTSTPSLLLPMSNPRPSGGTRVFRTVKTVPVPRNRGTLTKTGMPKTEDPHSGKIMDMKYLTGPTPNLFKQNCIPPLTYIQRPQSSTRPRDDADHPRPLAPSPSPSEEGQLRAAVPQKIPLPSRSMRANVGGVYARSLSPMVAGGARVHSVSPGPIGLRMVHSNTAHAPPMRAPLFAMWPYARGDGVENGVSPHVAYSPATLDPARGWMRAPRSLSPNNSANPPFVHGALTALTGAIFTPSPLLRAAKTPPPAGYCAPRVLRCPSPEMASQVRRLPLFPLRCLSPSRTAFNVPHIPCPPPVAPTPQSSQKEPGLRAGSSASLSAAPYSTMPVYPLTSGVPTPPSFAPPSFPCSPKSAAAGSWGLINAEATHSLCDTPLLPQTRALEIGSQLCPLPTTVLLDVSGAATVESPCNRSKASLNAPSEEGVGIAPSEVDVGIKQTPLPWRASSGRKACPQGHGLVSRVMWDGILPACNHCKRTLAHGEMFCSCYHCHYDACTTCLRDAETANASDRGSWTVDNTEHCTPLLVDGNEHMHVEGRQVFSEVKSSRMVAQPDTSSHATPTIRARTSLGVTQVTTTGTSVHAAPQSTAHILVTPVGGIDEVDNGTDNAGVVKPRDESVSIQARQYSRVSNGCRTFSSDLLVDHSEQPTELNGSDAILTHVEDTVSRSGKDAAHAGSTGVTVPVHGPIAAWALPSDNNNQKRDSAKRNTLPPRTVSVARDGANARRSMSPPEQRSSVSCSRATDDLWRPPARRWTDGPLPTPVRPIQRPFAPPRVISPPSNVAPQNVTAHHGTAPLPKKPDDALRMSVVPLALYLPRPSASEATLRTSDMADSSQSTAARVSIESAAGRISAGEDDVVAERTEWSVLVGDAAATRGRARTSTLYKSTACSVARAKERSSQAKAGEDASPQKDKSPPAKPSPTALLRGHAKVPKDGRFPSKASLIRPKSATTSQKKVPTSDKSRPAETAKAQQASRQGLPRARSPPKAVHALLEERPSTPNHLRRRQLQDNDAVAELHESVEVLGSQIQSLRNSISSTLESQHLQELGDALTTASGAKATAPSEAGAKGAPSRLAGPKKPKTKTEWDIIFGRTQAKARVQ